MGLIVGPDEFVNSQFEQQQGNLKYFVGKTAIVTIGSYSAHYQVCLITFGRDGSIYFAFPYFPSAAGIVSTPPISAEAQPPYQLRLADAGRVTSHMVKVSHHVSGIAQFSLTDKVENEIRRRSFRLDGPIGQILQLHIYWPSGFRQLEWTNRKKRVVYLPFVFRPTVPNAVTITIEWRRKAGIQANIDPPDRTSGPLADVQSRRTGDVFKVFFLGQPNTSPLQDHVLVVSCSEATPLASITEPTMIIIAGLDLHEVASVGERHQPSGMLAALYPVASYEAMKERIGTIDLVAGPGREMEQD